MRLVDGRVVMFTDSVVKQSGIRDLRPGDDVTITLKPTARRASAAQIRLREELATAGELRERIVTVEEELVRKLDRPINILLVGRTGVGKSRTINTLLGVEWATVGDHEPETAEIHCYEGIINGAEVVVVDTPGFCDDHPGKGNDNRYLREMVNQVERIDLMIFVTILDDTRVRGDEIHALELLTKSFGKEVWQKAVVVFTRADRFRALEYEGHRDGRFAAFRRRFREIVPEAGVVPFVPVSNERPRTPDRRLWLPVLWIACLERMSDEGFEPFFLSTATRLAGPAPKKTGKRGTDRRDAKAKEGAPADDGPSRGAGGREPRRAVRTPVPESNDQAPARHAESTTSKSRAKVGAPSGSGAGPAATTTPPAPSRGQRSKATPSRPNVAAVSRTPAKASPPGIQMPSLPASVDVIESGPPRPVAVENVSDQRQNGVRVVKTKFSAAQSRGSISIVGDNNQVLQVIERRAPGLLKKLVKVATKLLPVAVRRVLGL